MLPRRRRGGLRTTTPARSQPGNRQPPSRTARAREQVVADGAGGAPGVEHDRAAVGHDAVHAGVAQQRADRGRVERLAVQAAAGAAARGRRASRRTATSGRLPRVRGRDIGVVEEVAGHRDEGVGAPLRRECEPARRRRRSRWRRPTPPPRRGPGGIEPAATARPTRRGRRQVRTAGPTAPAVAPRPARRRRRPSWRIAVSVSRTDNADEAGHQVGLVLGEDRLRSGRSRGRRRRRPDRSPAARHAMPPR